jgi:hypothetical protein
MCSKLVFCALFVVTGTVLLSESSRTFAGGGDPKDEGYVKVEVKGKLKTGLLAPGGQTTGTIVETGPLTVELDFGTNEAFRALAKELDGKIVVAAGTLTTKLTTLKKTRLIVQVTSLKQLQ